MQRDEERLHAYDSIMQNLLTLKKRAVETRTGEAAAIESVLHNLSVLRDGEQVHSVIQAFVMPQDKDSNARPSGLGKIAVHAK